MVLAPMPDKAQGCPKPAQRAGSVTSVAYVAMILEHRAAAPFFKNGFVIGCEETREGVIIDPGDEVDELLDGGDAASA